MTRPNGNNAPAGADTGQMRLVAVVITATMLLWLGVQWLGGQQGWPTKYVFLADLVAMGALIWSLLVTWRIWRRRNASSRGQG
ncbi:DUF5337 domain-containing protein [Paracoccus laeviglucosivorans]|uniref:DUF5337 domain-containing protein n=1 Tax=Paracoccus laeviglucosivorans TaxID=1197861 RepID=A0A521AFJ0_9RHOB|nr:DUF5337 domain-containing protein [Paracoccus laeviglucosivorans]SMO33567.1 hypothetical protein SAMN06265221_101102 [Paracoccus laeviglucosivorans]